MRFGSEQIDAAQQAMSINAAPSPSLPQWRLAASEYI